MLKFVKILLQYVIVLIFSILFFSDATGASLYKRTLTRVEDFIVLTGSDVEPLIGSNVSGLRLYSCRHDACTAVPFQVDKVDSSGRYVFAEDKYYSADRDGISLDSNDELCFMASDAGDRIPASWRPEFALKGVEIELRDPLDSGRAWVYIFSEPGTEQPKVADYVDYEITSEFTTVTSDRFTVGWRTGSINYDLMRMLNSSGELGPDILDKQRIGMVGRLAKQNLSLNTPESIVSTVDVALKDGPVRVIVDQVMVINLAEFSFQFGSEYFMVYYRCGQNNSVFFSFPSALDKLFNSLVFYWSLDFNPDVLGSTYVDEHHPDKLKVAAGTIEGIENDAPHFWWGLYGRNGAVFQALDLDDDLLPYFACDGRWHQDPEARDKKGDFPGRIEIGLSCREVGSMPEQKDFHWLNYILFPAEPTFAGIRAMQNLVEHPLKVTAKEIQL